MCSAPVSMQPSTNAGLGPVTPWWPMPPAGPGYQPTMPDGAAQRPTTSEIDMQELGECLKSMRDPEQAQRVRYAVIMTQQADQMYRRGRPQASGEDWR
jgi:hypothetical protein